MQCKKGEEAFNSINHKLSQIRNAEKQGFIYRVHDHLRNVNRQAYEPAIVAIGPYHHDKESCKMMEEHKWRYLQLLLNRKKESTAERYIAAIGELEQEARNCYAEPINLSPDNFIKMLVLDGCFIIELVQKFEKVGYRYSSDPVFQLKWIRGSLRRDLIVFENQIPFFVLCKLFDLIEGPNKYNRLINLLLSFCEYLFPDAEYKRQKNSSSHDVKHLLDLIYSWWIPESFDGAIDLDVDYPVPVNRESRFIHSAAELKAANMKFKKRKSRDSLFEVKFQNGVMLMPPLTIEDRTECFFRNLIAYEQYFPDVRASYVTDYVIFLDLLINSSKDVDVLSECGIIDSSLGDNEVIANMFNRLNDSIEGSAKQVYGKTFVDINTFYNKRWNRWMAVLNREYFGSPWAYISLFAAFILLFITIIQTVCSVLQVA